MNPVRGSADPFYFDTKGGCFICLKHVVGISESSNNGSSTAGLVAPAAVVAVGNGIFSLGNLCRFLELNMELVQLLTGHLDSEDQPDLKVSLCEVCGEVLDWFSELLRKHLVLGPDRVNRVEMRRCLELIGGLLTRAGRDLALVIGFNQRMAPLHRLYLEAMHGLRLEISGKCMERAKTYEPGREPANQISGMNGEERGHPSDDSGAGTGLGFTPPVIPEATEESKNGSLFLCHLCGMMLASQRMLQRHLKVMHGEVMVPLPRSPVPSPISRRPAMIWRPRAIAAAHQLIARSKKYLSGKVRTPNFQEVSQIQVGTPLDLVETPGGGVPKKTIPPLLWVDPNVPSSSSPVPGAAVEPVKIISVANPKTGLYECGRCPRSFRSRDGYRHHFNLVHLSIRYECEVCNKRLVSLRNYKIHYRGKHLDRRFNCDLCDRMFHYPSGLYRHRQTAHFGRRYKCKYCPSTFGSENGRHYHMTRVCKQRKGD